MPINLIFWAIFLVLIIYGLIWRFGGGPWFSSYGGYGIWVLAFVLIFLLGWAEFGFIVQGTAPRYHPF